MDSEDDLHLAERELAELDPRLGALIGSQPPIILGPQADYFFSLCRSIIGQQVSVASASAIFGRLDAATGLDPTSVAALTDDDTRTIGLSRQKTAYIRDLALHFVDNPDVYAHLDQSSDEEVITELTIIKGIGTWTAQMFLMFTLRRPDVFAPDDIGLQRAMKQLYGWDSVPSKRELEATSDRWRPYRTVASLHLWQSIETTPV
jgi:DNA-3-methyladenine glycosylase II